MLEAIFNHAVANIWCTPDQDYQYIFQPARLSNPAGVKREVKIEWVTHRLPDTTHTWHLFQIGQLSPLYLNLIPDSHQWYCAQSLCQHQSLLVNAYVNDGRQFPRLTVYFQKTARRNLLVAVRKEKVLPDLTSQPLYLRFYTNAFFQSERANHLTDQVVIEGKTVATRQETVQFQNRFRSFQTRPGHVSVYHNGWLVEDTHPDDITSGDFVEFVYDASVKEVSDFPVDTLDTFTSSLDNVHKYLISRGKTDDNTIDYLDDIDIYLLRPKTRGFEGVYFHKNQVSAVRQLTHQDYAIPAGRVVAFANDFSAWNDPRDLVVRVKVRHSGYHRPLVWEHGRIHELYHLTDEQIYRAMVGTNSTVSVWRADQLESSGYPKVMGAKWDELSYPLLQDTYGYHGITKILADTPQYTEYAGSWHRATLPISLREYATVFEYDQAGVLTDWYYHSASVYHTVRNTTTRLVEALVGRGSPTLDTHYGHQSVTLDPDVNYRMYLSSAVAGVSNNDWWDVTDQEGVVYDIVNGTVQWKTDPQLTEPAVRSDRDFLTYRFTLPFQRGYLRFTIEAREFQDGVAQTTELEIPTGQLDVFLNGRSLIENLDYFVKWPEVVITNKAFLVEGWDQDVVVRASGFCRPDMTREPPAEVGFITHGLLSHNRRYNLRDDKVMRMVINGTLQHPSMLKFSEHDSGLRIDHIRNGAPYQLRDTVVPVRGLVDTDPYTFRQRSLVVDKEVEDYLTLLYPEPEIDLPSIIPHRHLLYSPFLSAIHEDLLYGVFSIEEKKRHYSDMDIKRWLKDYEWLLDFEPLYHPVDDKYVLVHAHRFLDTTTLNIYQYTFLMRVIELYFPGKVDLSHSVAAP